MTDAAPTTGGSDAPKAKAGGKGFSVGGHKVGPFGPAVWIGIAGAGVAIGLIWRLKKGGGGGGVTGAATTVAPASAYPGGYPLGAGGTGAAGPGLLPATDAGISSNAVWLAKSVERLIAEGQNPTLVHGALSKFLRGDPLTPQERAIVDMAVRYFGSPPEGAAAVSVIGTAVPPPYTAPSMDPSAAPTDLRGLSAKALLDRADQLIGSGSGYEAAVAELTRRVTVDKSLSVNDLVWRQGGVESGSPRQSWFVAAPQILNWLASQGLRFS